MSSQNRPTQKVRLVAGHDSQVHLRAELEIGKLHPCFHELRDQEWLKLVEMQQQQIRMLQDIIAELKSTSRGGA